MIFAVIDTNVLVSALLSRHSDAATVRVLDAVANRQVVPLFNALIMAEYREVLSRSRFHFAPDLVAGVVDAIAQLGLDVDVLHYDHPLPDEKDRVFFEVALAGQSDSAKLVTGNLKHFPSVPFVVTPAQLCEMLESSTEVSVSGVSL